MEPLPIPEMVKLALAAVYAFVLTFLFLYFLANAEKRGFRRTAAKALRLGRRAYFTVALIAMIVFLLAWRS
jgi:hypothetical protein